MMRRVVQRYFVTSLNTRIVSGTDSVIKELQFSHDFQTVHCPVEHQEVQLFKDLNPLLATARRHD